MVFVILQIVIVYFLFGQKVLIDFSLRSSNSSADCKATDYINPRLNTFYNISLFPATCTNEHFFT